MYWVTKALLFAALALCVATDVRRRKVPNAVTFPGIALGVLLGALTAGWAGALDSLYGLLLALAIPLPLFARGALGAGDVKLLGMVGAFVGRELALRVILYAALTGGLIAVLVLLSRRKLIGTLANLARNLQLRCLGASVDLDYGAERQTLPYSIPIALGSVISLLLAG